MNKDTPVSRAVAMLNRAGIPAFQTSYGFSVQAPPSGEPWMRAGLEHDTSISLSVQTDETPPVVWFFRDSFPAMAAFLVEAHQAAGEGAARCEVVRAMRVTDARYDHDALDRRLEAERQRLWGGALAEE